MMRWLCGDEALEKERLANNGALSGVVLGIILGAVRGNYFVAMPEASSRPLLSS